MSERSERAPQKHIGLYFLIMVWRYKRQYRTKHWHWENLWINYASERAWKLFPFSHSKTAISLNILLVLLILYLRNTYIFRSQITSSYTYKQCSFHVITYGMALYINDSYVYRQNTNIEKIYVYNFYILNLLFLSIFCWYFRYFVGTNDMLVGLHVATNFEMYPLRKSLVRAQPAL